MIRPSARLAIAALAVLVMAPPAIAQKPSMPLPPPPVEIQPDHPAYGDLIDAMNAAIDQDAALDAMSATIAREYGKVPQIAAMEQAKPGLIDAIVLAMRPTLKTYGQRVQADYRPRTRAMLANYLTPADAEDLAAFYRSPLGRKLMGQASRSLTMDSTLSGIGDDISAGKDPTEVTIDSAQINSDIDKASRSAVGALSEDDLAELGRLTMEKPALLKLAAIRDDMLALRTQMENEQPTPAEAAAIERAVIGTLERHVGK